VLYAVASVCAILLQYPFSVLTGTPQRALRGYGCAALCLAGASLGFAAARAHSVQVTAAIFTAAIVILTVGEIMQVGAAWTLSFAIAPLDNRSTYLAAFSMGRALSRATGPLLMTGVVLALGQSGWIALSALFAAAALVPAIAGKRTARAGDGMARARAVPTGEGTVRRRPAGSAAVHAGRRTSDPLRSGRAKARRRTRQG
jgi:MFS family permease